MRKLVRLNLFAAVLFLTLSCCKTKQTPFSAPTATTTEWNTLSELFLQQIIDGQDTQELQDQLANTSIADLQKSLQTDAQRYAFWINIYNAYIQVILREHPEYYENRGSFFSEEQIAIAGEMVSFATIEHGILRKSQWDKGLGYVRKWFPGTFERKLRVDERDYRIHFALNCGAKDCPPVAIYTPHQLEEQLKTGTERFLKASTTFDPQTQNVAVTALFSWFRGDFGGKRGTKKILEAHKLIPQTEGVDLDYTNYDWTLALDNFIDL